MNTKEYVTSQNASSAYTTTVSVGSGGAEFDYKESGSWTWKASVCPLGIVFQAFGQAISIDVTVQVTSGWTQWVRAVFNNTSNSTLDFLVYTPGAQPVANGFGGMELHVWDLSGAG
jgi:hypothetical protein